jgi:hypothetical protein
MVGELTGVGRLPTRALAEEIRVARDAFREHIRHRTWCSLPFVQRAIDLVFIAEHDQSERIG